MGAVVLTLFAPQVAPLVSFLPSSLLRISKDVLGDWLLEIVYHLVRFLHRIDEVGLRVQDLLI